MDIPENWKEKVSKMDRYTRLLFGVTCPYSGEKCETEIDCLECLVEKEERRLYEEEQEEHEEFRQRAEKGCGNERKPLLGRNSG